MRVGLLAYGLAGPLAGISRYTLELAAALARLGGALELVLLNAGELGTRAEELHLSHTPLHGCRLLPGLVTLGNMEVRRAARRERLDIVHDPTGVSPFLFGAGGAKTVVTIHDVFAWSCPGNSTLLDTLIYRYWLPHLAKRVGRVITDSQASRSDIERYLRVPAERVRVVYPGVSTAYRPLPVAEIAAARARYDLPDSYILYVGSVERRKNLERLLRAFALLRGSGERRSLVIVGVRKANAAGMMGTLSELGLQKDVILTGYVAEADLPAIYGGADLFVFPSLYEGFGLPPLEAMACGAPVVCSNAASLPEVVGNAALMVDPYDVQGLAHAMRRVLADGALSADLRAKGLERARRFTWERAAQETMAVYREALA